MAREKDVLSKPNEHGAHRGDHGGVHADRPLRENGLNAGNTLILGGHGFARCSSNYERGREEGWR
jgi:hypothetical protein